MSEELVIIFCVVVLPIAIVLIVNVCNYFNWKNKCRVIEKALELQQVSPEILEKLMPEKRRGNGLLIAGLILLGFGIGLGILCWVESSIKEAVAVGAMFVFTGIGMIAAHYLTKPKEQNND